MPGVSTGARTSFEQAVLDLQKQLSGGNKNYKITPDEYNKLAEQFFGKLADTLPPGAKVIQQNSPLELTYELDGKQYKAFRNTDSNLGIDTGKVETTLLSSPIDKQSAAGEQDLLSAALPDIFKQFVSAPDTNGGSKGDISGWLSKLMANADTLSAQRGLQPIDPATQALLDQITGASNARLDQQFGDESSKLVSQLYGKGINKSNIAGQEANRLTQGHGLVQQQANADAASRALAVSQYLTQALQGNLALAGEQYTSGAAQTNQNYNSETGRQGNTLNFVQNLLNQALQRETSGVSLGQGQEQIDNQQSQFDKNYGLAQQQYETQAAAQRHADRLRVIQGIIGTITGIGTSLASAAMGGSGSSGAGSGGAPPVGGDGGYG